MRALSKKGIPALMVNGRISPGSYKGYRYFRFFMKRVLELFDHMNMQTKADAERITAIGAPESIVSVAGNVKFDQAHKARKGGEDKKIFTKAALGIPEGSLVVIAGSTHAGEEAEALVAYRRILESYPDAFLIIAPRHPERLPEVRALLKAEGFRFRVKSALKGAQLEGPEVIVLDTMGELAALYRAGDINFVGGSWSDTGGHNILEPAAFGKPVFFGPNMHNFSEISAILKDCGVGIEVKDGLALAREAVRLVQEPERLETLGKLAKATLQKNRGALTRNVELIKRYLYG
jgi:3-deoxy-D-manno-octulosonic-acid transferase